MTDIGKLVLEAQKGNQQAMAALYEQCYRCACYLARQLVKDEDEVQDILQESYIKAFSHLNTLQEPDKFQAWLGRIVTNKCKDYLKQKRPMTFSDVFTDEEGKSSDDIEDDSEAFSPDATVDYKETKRLVQEMIDELPEEQRIAIVLRYLEDLPIKQIAEFMECSEGTIKSRLNYGRKSIKEKVMLLEKKGTKLYCMPLIPFICWMYRQDALAAVLPAAANSVGAIKVVLDGAAAEIVGVAGAAATGAGAGAAGSGAATAGKAGISLFGKTISMKVAAIGAAVVIGGGAAGSIHIYSQKQAENVTETDAQQPESTENALQEMVEDMGLSKEERALKALYKAAESGDNGEIDRVFGENFSLIYEMGAEKEPGSYLVFDGESVSDTLEGRCLAIRLKSRMGTISVKGEKTDREEMEITCHFGEFKEGKPEGELLSFVKTCIPKRKSPYVRSTFTSAVYENGVCTSNPVKVETLGRNEITGYYNGETKEPFGNFEITLYIADLLGQVFEIGRYESMNNPVEDVGTLHFSVEISYEDESRENSYRDCYSQFYTNMAGILYMESGDEYLPDNSRNYAVDAGTLRYEIKDAIFWDGEGSSCEAGTENARPVEWKDSYAWKDDSSEQPEETEPPEENTEILNLMEEYGFNLDCWLNASSMKDMGEYYEIQAMVVAPLTFEENPMEGKGAGDVVPIEVSRLKGRVTDFAVSNAVYDADIGDMTCYQDEKSGVWKFIGSNDMVLATEVYNGTLKLSKDAVIYMFEYGNMEYINGWWEGYETITPKELADSSEFYDIWGLTTELKISEDEWNDEYIYNPEMGNIESTGKQVMSPSYVMIPGGYSIVLNSDGEIVLMRRNWRP